MEAVLKPPSAFQFDNNLTSVTSGNLCKSWEDWKKSFLVYFEACELSKKTVTVQINILLHVIGPKCREVYEQFKKKSESLSDVLSQFDEFFLPKKNTTVERHKFFTREQKDFESTEQYVYELNKMAATCNFKDLCDELVKDRLICGINDGALRERLLREPDLTLSRALDICRLAELSRVQAGSIKTERSSHHVHEVNHHNGDCSEQPGSGEGSVSWVQSGRCRCGAAQAQHASGTRDARDRRRRGRGRGRGRARAQGRPGPPAAAAPPYQGSSANKVQSVCSKCGINHELYKCPAYGVQCNNCNRYNHYAKMCRRQVYAIDGESSDQGGETS
ncbi:hypothetical protein JYU34_017315 [Plutella xylostella]|uniref:Retrotransposon gag domain-containing protein n=1 Tax=Plutella xylostella TaxID=51655 RepID=A0ABQ7Q286_PLUXY|nr:uncharacterized protein LOC119692026 [Plutella xylostella]XP_037971365.2 uncharacterized protein LOC119693086 [Plutella xylostella]XP_037977500.2 uncharacterized protein LOC119694698 [Plutella xylostella]XP_048484029.1 uncharacterized protein LOC125490056 [Plutella xylostella]KAG7298860.1 hypothetical protein JYU34_017315 [Plutella xylostella]